MFYRVNNLEKIDKNTVKTVMGIKNETTDGNLELIENSH